MHRFILVICAMISVQVYGATLELGFGPSIPKAEVTTILSLPAGVSRNNGGEHLYVSFKTAKNISSIKLIGYSASRIGKVLIRSASAVTDTKQNIGLEGLSNFSKMGLNERSENYQNLVMLADQSSVSVQPNLALTSLDIMVEGFANNDASILLQITSIDDLSSKEFMVTRSGAGAESVGGYFDENNYARFTIPQLQLLMKTAKTPTISDLVGKTFLCSGYSIGDLPNFDYKTRQFFVGHTPNVLQSSTDLHSSPSVWIKNQYGWTISTKLKNCDVSYNIYIRMTSEGNLIGEWNFNTNEYLHFCRENYDEVTIRDSLARYGAASLVDPKFTGRSYEFCKLVTP